MKRRLRRGGCVAWRQVARTVVSETPTCAAIWLTDMPVRARSRICCFFAALIGRQAVLRMPRAVGVSLASVVGATLDLFDSGATSPAMRRLRKTSRGFQLFVSSLLAHLATSHTLYANSVLARLTLLELSKLTYKQYAGVYAIKRIPQ